MRTLLAILCLTAACRTSSIRERWTYVDNPARIDSVELYVSIQHDAMIGVMFRSFEKRMQARLGACGVQTTIVHGRPEGEALRGSAPRLAVAPYEGRYTNVRVVDQYGQTLDERRTTKLDASFRIELFDPRVRKPTWRLIVEVKTSTTPNLDDGEDFADLILARMKAAGVIACGG